jgi:hypothetical protein
VDAAKQDEQQQKTAPAAARSLRSAEKKASEMPALTLSVMDREKAAQEIEVILSKLGGSIQAVDEQEAKTTLTIHLDPTERKTFFEQIGRIGSIKETETPPKIATDLHFLLIIINQ